MKFDGKSRVTGILLEAGKRLQRHQAVCGQESRDLHRQERWRRPILHRLACKILKIKELFSSPGPGNNGCIFHNRGIERARGGVKHLAISVPSLLFLLGLSEAGVAQLVEHLICNQRVGGSIPSASSTAGWVRQGMRRRISEVKIERAGVFRHESVLCFR